jgi:putrescine transport system ATP-binding protein
MNIKSELGITFVVVTHDQEEAMTLSTRIAVMDAGRFVQTGTPTQIYEFPESTLIACFISITNIFEGRIEENSIDHVTVSTNKPKCDIRIDHGSSEQEGSKVWVSVRPEKSGYRRHRPMPRLQIN